MIGNLASDPVTAKWIAANGEIIVERLRNDARRNHLRHQAGHYAVGVEEPARRQIFVTNSVLKTEDGSLSAECFTKLQ